MHLLSDAPLRQGDGAVQRFRAIKYAHYSRFGMPQLEEFDPAACLCDSGSGDSAVLSAATSLGSTAAGLASRPSGAMCPQRPSRLAALLGEAGVPRIEEGSLYLSVFAPADITEEEFGKLPVLVWIHGGAFLTGGSEEPRYGMERLVEAGRLIGVKISYRLGALGYLYMPEMGAVNLGLEDQKAALQWIQLHISAFGGDPSRVTLMGQSAGAMSIAALIASGCGGTLFSQAVIQSAPLALNLSEKKAKQIANVFLKELGEDIMTASVEKILDTQDKVNKMRLNIGLTYMPVMDLCHIPESLPKRVVCGTQKDDAVPFVPLAVSPLATPILFTRPNKRYLAKLRSAGVETSSYHLSWHPSGSTMGACHCIELPFLLGCYEDWTNATMLRGFSRDEFDRRSAQYLRAWTRFANGDSFSLD